MRLDQVIAEVAARVIDFPDTRVGRDGGVVLNADIPARRSNNRTGGRRGCLRKFTSRLVFNTPACVCLVGLLLLLIVKLRHVVVLCGIFCPSVERVPNTPLGSESALLISS